VFKYPQASPRCHKQPDIAYWVLHVVSAWSRVYRRRATGAVLLAPSDRSAPDRDNVPDPELSSEYRHEYRVGGWIPARNVDYPV
jgi:hypothetical protein